MKLVILLLLTVNFYSANGQDSEDLIEISDRLYHSSQLEEALNILLKAEKNGSTSPYIYHRIGMLYIDFNKPDLALKYLIRTQEINTNDSLATAIHLDLGQAYILIREFDKASQELEFIVNNKFYRENALTLFMGIYSVQKEFDKAIEIAQELLSNDPTDLPIIGNLGYLFLEMEDYDSAIVYFKRVLSIDTNDQLAYNNIGNCYYHKGQLTKALNYIEESIRLDPNNAYAYRNRGLVYSAMSKPILACQEYDKALGLGYIKMYGEDILKFKEDSCK